MLTLKHLLLPEINYILINEGKIYLFENIKHLNYEQVYCNDYVLMKCNDKLFEVFEKITFKVYRFNRNKFQDLLNMVNKRPKPKFNWQKEGF